MPAMMQTLPILNTCVRYPRQLHLGGVPAQQGTDAQAYGVRITERT